MSTRSYYYSSPKTSPRPSLHHLPPQLSSCLTVTAGFYVGMFLGVDRHYVGTCVCNSDWNCVATFLAFLAFYEFVSWHVWSGLHELSLTSRAFWDTSLGACDWHYVGTFIGMSEWHDVFSSLGISGNVSPVQLHPILQPASWDTRWAEVTQSDIHSVTTPVAMIINTFVPCGPVCHTSCPPQKCPFLQTGSSVDVAELNIWSVGTTATVGSFVWTQGHLGWRTKSEKNILLEISLV